MVRLVTGWGDSSDAVSLRGLPPLGTDGATQSSKKHVNISKSNIA